MIFKNRIIIFILLLSLYGCGYSTIYTKDENRNFNILSLKIDGDTEINNYLKSNLNKYKNNNLGKSYVVSINTYFTKKSLAKDRTGKVTDLKLIATLNLNYQIKKNDSNNNEKKNVSFSESFNIKKNQNNFEQRDYEKSIKKNLSQLLSDKIIHHLSLNK